MSILALVTATLLASCGAPGVSPSPSPALSIAELKYRVAGAAGRPWFCDPDEHPVARFDEQTLATQRLPEIRRDRETYAAILAHLGLARTATLTAQQELAVYREWKTLNALPLSWEGNGYRFAIRVMRSKGEGEQVEGAVDARGNVRVTKRSPTGPPICPICLASATRIATPAGEVRVEEVSVGMLVWTLDAAGRRVAAPVVAVGHTPAPAEHEVVRVALGDGRVVLVSPGHPALDGRRAGDLVPGDELDGGIVLEASRVRYTGGATFDLLPAGGTGAYWANGILLRSTLGR